MGNVDEGEPFGEALGGETARVQTASDGEVPFGDAVLDVDGEVERFGSGSSGL
jgi:hypothetical protein